ncbi:hypothetical protein ALC60_01121 [Trachymyrmex zeteki]|uniref:Uncharacterized protein n=1 Tax=Mycetomoellerius zeteki TaxID=64791 RepID=A0A151XH63_9HYME|nr:hypothetical protein ALC60_01121 [Trachymyrmex zeteki]
MFPCFLPRPAASLRHFGKIEGSSPRQRSVTIAVPLIREGFRSLQRGSPRAVHDRSWIRGWAQRGRVKSPAEEEISGMVGERGGCRRLFVAVYTVNGLIAAIFRDGLLRIVRMKCHPDSRHTCQNSSTFEIRTNSGKRVCAPKLRAARCMLGYRVTYRR